MTTSIKTGGSVDYYTCSVPRARTIDGRPGYDAQCLEIIETLGMSFAEGEAFKAIWRSCAARTLGKVKADCNALYNAEKVAFYGQRMVVEAKMQGDLAEGLIDATCAESNGKYVPTWGVLEEDTGGFKPKTTAVLIGLPDGWVQYFEGVNEPEEGTDVFVMDKNGDMLPTAIRVGYFSWCGIIAYKTAKNLDQSERGPSELPGSSVSLKDFITKLKGSSGQRPLAGS